MNIHFTDNLLKSQLDSATLCQIEFGSTLYGLNTKKSDTDILCIYAQSINNCQSILSYEHTLQYVGEENIDYIYVSLSQFVKSLIKGDCTTYFEVLHTAEFKQHFEKLYTIKQYFYHNKIMDAYLGLAKRDLRLAKKEHVLFGSKKKKLSHTLRGLYSFDMLIQQQYVNKFNIEQWQHLYNLKYTDYVNESNYLAIETEIQKELDNRMSIAKSVLSQYVLTVSQLLEINAITKSYLNSEYYLSKLTEIDSDAFFAIAMIDGINYKERELI